MRKWFLVSLTALMVFCAAPEAKAQNWPAQPITLINGFPPGGGADILARLFAEKLRDALGQPVTVENRTGANGLIAAAAVAAARPDGYTLLHDATPLAINPFLLRVSFDALVDLKAVFLPMQVPMLLVMNPAQAPKSLAEVIALAKNPSQQVNYASSGSGTSIHMSGEMFKFLTGVNMLHIPYKGSAPAVNDLLGGQVMMMFDNIPSALPHIKAGKLRALATTGAKRDPTLPDLPTIAEAGVANYESGVWFGLSVPVGTPPEIIAKLSAEAIKGI